MKKSMQVRSKTLLMATLIIIINSLSYSREVEVHKSINRMDEKADKVSQSRGKDVGWDSHQE